MLPDWTETSHEQSFLLSLAASSALATSALQEAADQVSGLLLKMGYGCKPQPSTVRANVRQLVFDASGQNAGQVWQQISERVTPMDIWVRPLQLAPLKLLLCDMDSTIIPTESLDELAAEVGIGEQVAAITARAMNGELDFARALDERVALLKGLDVAIIDSCVAQTQINPGAEELIKQARAHGVFTVLISGGFGPFVEHVAARLGFDRWVANTLDIENGALTGRVRAPLIDKHSKLTTLNEEMLRLGISVEQTAAVGDGANDIAMLRQSGFGIAYRAKPSVLEHTPYRLQHAEFDSLLSLFPLTVEKTNPADMSNHPDR